MCIDVGFPRSQTGGWIVFVLGLIFISCVVQGSWEIGIVEEVDDATGDVTELNSVCTSEGFQAEDVSGPTDVQLEGAWQCEYPQKYWYSKTKV